MVHLGIGVKERYHIKNEFYPCYQFTERSVQHLDVPGTCLILQTFRHCSSRALSHMITSLRAPIIGKYIKKNYISEFVPFNITKAAIMKVRLFFIFFKNILLGLSGLPYANTRQVSVSVISFSAKLPHGSGRVNPCTLKCFHLTT